MDCLTTKDRLCCRCVFSLWKSEHQIALAIILCVLWAFRKKHYHFWGISKQFAVDQNFNINDCFFFRMARRSPSSTKNACIHCFLLLFMASRSHAWGWIDGKVCNGSEVIQSRKNLKKVVFKGSKIRRIAQDITNFSSTFRLSSLYGTRWRTSTYPRTINL